MLETIRVKLFSSRETVRLIKELEAAKITR